MSAIVQIEFSASTLNLREELLQSLGRPVFSLLGSESARRLDLTARDVGVISIGHGTTWKERRELVAYFKTVLPRLPVLASLRRTDDPDMTDLTKLSSRISRSANVWRSFSPSVVFSSHKRQNLE